MKGFSYEKTFQLCQAYHFLGVQEAAIIDVLFEANRFYGDYSEMGRRIGRNASNTRKAILNLEKMGLVHIERGGTGRMTNCALIEGWMDILIKNYEEEAR